MIKRVLLNLPSVVSYPFININGARFIIKSEPMYISQKYHRMPSWMSPHLHITLEKAMTYYPVPLIATLLGIPYHILHGLICGYDMREIMNFIKKYYRTTTRVGGVRVAKVGQSSGDKPT